MPDFTDIRQRMSRVAQMVRLPLRAGQWSGLNGQIQGLGTGSSLDFQDQRPYVPGDDPRHINWQAYARNGSYTMKLYRQEVSPRVDLVLDASPSMFLNEAKTRRVWETVWFCIESALRLGAALKVHLVSGSGREVPMDHVLADRWPLEEIAASSTGLRLDLLALRPGSLRVLISDVLFPASPDLCLTPLVAQRGRALVLAPFCQEEADPDWSGNIDFEDCESTQRDRRRVPQSTLERYREAYRRHFDLWREPCQRRGIAFARIGAEGDFIAALRAEAATVGAVELT